MITQVNSGGSHDINQVAVKIEPDFVAIAYKDEFTNSSYQDSILRDFQYSNPVGPFAPLSQIQKHLPVKLVQHHGLREIQIISLQFAYKYEIQVSFRCITAINSTSIEFGNLMTIFSKICHTFEMQTIFLSGITSGTYIIVIQDAGITSELSISANAGTIANALKTAASQIYAPIRECSSFSVSVKQYSSTSTTRIDVSFLVDNSQDLSMLQIFDSSLDGTANNILHLSFCRLNINNLASF